MPGRRHRPLKGPPPRRSLYALTPAAGVRAAALASSMRSTSRGTPLAVVASAGAMATPSTSQTTPQRLAAIREQLSLLSDYL